MQKTGQISSAWCKKQVKSQVLGAKTQVESLVLGRFAVLG
jgi:hypothetical protein